MCENYTLMILNKILIEGLTNWLIYENLGFNLIQLLVWSSCWDNPKLYGYKSIFALDKKNCYRFTKQSIVFLVFFFYKIYELSG